MLKLISKLHSERGQSIVTIGLMSVFILGLLGVVADTGFVWMQKRSLQNAADAAALAAAQKLPGDQSGATDLANQYVVANGGGIVTVEFGDIIAGGLPTSVKVTVRKDSETLFGATLGFGNKNVPATAKAKIRSQNLPGKGVVPIGVEKSDYDALVASGGTVTLKDKGQAGANSNSGLVNLIGDNGDQIRDGFKFGSGVPLQPTLNTEPGNKFGQATQNAGSGLQVRLRRSILHPRTDDNTKHCYTWADVQPPSDPNAYWPCSPANATESDGVQATAVILVPIIVEDFTQFNGTKTIHVQPTAGGAAYLLAYFWVDGNSTYVNPSGGNYNLNPSNPNGAMYGRFILGVAAQLSEFDPTNCRTSDGCGLVDYDPQAVVKVVQLVE